MLAKRVIPCMDVKDGRVVKGVNFVNLRDAGDPIELAQRYDEQRADEVIFLDITATSDDRATTVELASRASEQLHLPYCVGGGFRSVADIRKMIAAGADKVSVNSAAVANPELITQAATAFGTQAILCAIDAKQRADNPNKWEVYVHGGRKATGIDAVEWAQEAARCGAGESPAHEHGPRRQPRRVRLRPYAGRGARSEHSRYRERRRRQDRALRRGYFGGRSRRCTCRKRIPFRRDDRMPGEGIHALAGHSRAPVTCLSQACRTNRKDTNIHGSD